MKTVKYNPASAFPADMGHKPPELSILVNDQTFSLAEMIHNDYGTGIGEICAIIERVKEQVEILQDLKKRHEMSRTIERNTCVEEMNLPGGGTGLFSSSDMEISSISVQTKYGSFKITDDPFLFELIKKRYAPSNRWETSFRDALNTILYYLDFRTELGPYQQNVIIGLIAHHCGLYPKNTPIRSEKEYNSAELQAGSYKSYLNQTVKTWRK